jgi:hypothetical protein
MFFRGTLKTADEELTEINPRQHILNFGSLQPGEKVVGKLTDNERRAYIWAALVTEELRIVSEKILLDSTLRNKKQERDTYESEMQIIKDKDALIMRNVAYSLCCRFGTQQLYALREDGLVI